MTAWIQRSWGERAWLFLPQSVHRHAHAWPLGCKSCQASCLSSASTTWDEATGTRVTVKSITAAETSVTIHSRHILQFLSFARTFRTLWFILQLHQIMDLKRQVLNNVYEGRCYRFLLSIYFGNLPIYQFSCIYKVISENQKKYKLYLSLWIDRN